ncbi:MAG TPA: HRDC domain-containing protein [Bacteroidales bacterium]|nr:HRDC domain-containing protein [Bacteroidales bacterium]
MQIQIFTVVVHNNSEELAKLNSFLRGHKIIDIDKQFVNNGQESFWSFCIRYIENGLTLSNVAKTEKTDYKNVLDETTFKTFSQLRSIRKKLAEEDAVPAYAVFTDEELANIARLPEINNNDMLKIKGIGIKKVEKYGKRIQELTKTDTE